MKTKDIIQYEKNNENTILLIVNKTVCRAFETSAFLLSKCIPIEKFYCKYSSAANIHMLYTWFSARKLDNVLDMLRLHGFYPISCKEGSILLGKENIKPDGYGEWREKVYDEIMVEQHSYTTGHSKTE